MVKIAHAGLALTAVIWPASFVSLLVSDLPLGLIAVAALLTFVLFSIRYIKGITRTALAAYYQAEASYKTETVSELY